MSETGVCVREWRREGEEVRKSEENMRVKRGKIGERYHTGFEYGLRYNQCLWSWVSV